MSPRRPFDGEPVTDALVGPVSGRVRRTVGGGAWALSQRNYGQRRLQGGGVAGRGAQRGAFCWQ